MIINPAFRQLEKRIKRRVCGQPHYFRAVSHLGFEGALAAELNRLGFTGTTQVPSGIAFEAKFADAWKVCAFARTARKLEMELAHFHAENFGKLEKEFEKVPWELYLPPNCEPKISAKCKKSRLYHSDAVAERLEPILKDRLFAGNGLAKGEGFEGGAFGHEAAATEPQKISIELENDACTIFLDLSGEPLYKRGHNRFVEEAPLQETMAASILLAGGLASAPALLDPMCGSGTFSLEAAAIAKGHHPGLSRHFAFEGEPAFGREAYNYALAHAPAPDVLPGFSIYTADINPKAVQTATHNATCCGETELVKPTIADFFKQKIPYQKGSLLVLNPPYGLRIKADTVNLYKEIGKKIKLDYRSCKIALLCPDRKCFAAFNPGMASVVRTNHGGLDIFAIFGEAHRL